MTAIPAGALGRTPPIAIRRQLAAEVGFGCPVEGCASPYLEWHHFDPGWADHQHHDASSMIALCHEHHAKAGTGAFTKPQLRHLKSIGAADTKRVAGRFDWLRRDLVFVAGGLWFYETPNLIVVQEHPLIWYTRLDGLMRVSLRLPEPAGWRFTMDENFWFNLADAEALVCPPGGQRLTVNYSDGDVVGLHFREMKNREDAERAFGAVPEPTPFPCTTLSIRLRIGRLGIDMAPGASQVAGISFHGVWCGNSPNGIVIG